jgi:hypothetical protein
MKHLIALATVLGGCAVQSSFQFTLSDGTVATSSAQASGDVDNAGFVTLSDPTWSITMNLLGLSPGNHAVGGGSGDLQIARAATGETYMLSLGGTCNVWLDPHNATNGSPVDGHFTCTGLTSTMGKKVDVTNATFEVPINDPANNPIHK